MLLASALHFSLSTVSSASAEAAKTVFCSVSSTSSQKIDTLRKTLSNTAKVNKAIALKKTSTIKSIRKIITLKANAFAVFINQIDPSGRLLNYFAATLSSSQIQKLGASLKGKHFELTVSKNGKASISIKGKGKFTRAQLLNAVNSTKTTSKPSFGNPIGYDCWQAYVASFTFALGMGMICMPTGLAGGVLCGAVAQVALPIDWNAACKK